MTAVIVKWFIVGVLSLAMLTAVAENCRKRQAAVAVLVVVLQGLIITGIVVFWRSC